MAEPVLAHLSLTPRVFSLSEMWAPHLFSYMALSGLSVSSENSEVLMESTQLAIFATFWAYLRLHIPSILSEK